MQRQGKREIESDTEPYKFNFDVAEAAWGRKSLKLQIWLWHIQGSTKMTSDTSNYPEVIKDVWVGSFVLARNMWVVSNFPPRSLLEKRMVCVHVISFERSRKSVLPKLPTAANNISVGADSFKKPPRHHVVMIWCRTS